MQRDGEGQGVASLTSPISVDINVNVDGDGKALFWTIVVKFVAEIEQCSVIGPHLETSGWPRAKNLLDMEKERLACATM